MFLLFFHYSYVFSFLRVKAFVQRPTLKACTNNFGDDKYAKDHVDQ